MKIYHFANLTYGLPFIDWYNKLPESITQKIEIHIIFVYPNKDLPLHRPIRSFVKYLRNRQFEASIQKRFANHPFSVKCCRDVNSRAFWQNIPADCIGLCTGFNQIFSKQLLGKLRLCINVHPSLLPYYRGPVPTYWVLKNQETITGFTLHQMTSQIDAGTIIYQEKVAILADDDPISLEQRIAQIASEKLGVFILSLIEKRAFHKKIVNPERIYQQLVDYRSFPSDPT